jgi:Cys-tRNA(Pro)/Cys-tRNA(Cys) deacylase
MSTEQTPGAPTGTRVEGATSFLDGAGISYELIEHAPVASAGAEADEVGRPHAQTAKTIVLHDGRAYVIVAISAADRLDLHKLRALLGASRQLRLASEEEIAREFPTLEVGAVPPFGPMVPVAEVFDRGLAAQKQIVCPAGDHRHSVALAPADVIRATSAKVADITED